MKLFLSLLLAAILFAGGMAAYGTYLYRQSGPLAQEKAFEITKGSGSRQIAEHLAKEKIIRNYWVFLAGLKMRGSAATLKAGEYEFPAHASMRAIQDQMIAGKVVQRKVTIPEGRTSFEIVDILKSTEGLSGGIDKIPAEGTLLPDTYHFTKNEPRIDKLSQMAAAMDKVRADLWDARASDLPLSTWEEAVTLASIVEKETGVASERSRIAGVFVNRLQRGIPLQSDPTVIYALTEGKPKNDGQGPLGRRLLSKDLEIDSPYNTYKNVGLPPAPIANPGKAAIEAVLHPEQNNFLYFVADGTGGHVFAATLAEHNRNVAKWRALRRHKE